MIMSTIMSFEAIKCVCDVCRTFLFLGLPSRPMMRKVKTLSSGSDGRRRFTTPACPDDPPAAWDTCNTSQSASQKLPIQTKRLAHEIPP